MKAYIAFCLFVFYLTVSVQAAGKSSLTVPANEKEAKALLKTKPNLLILFARNDASAKSTVKLLKEVNPEVTGLATLAYVNCESNKKICKLFKVKPDPIELKHFNNGKFNVDYERAMTVKSVLNFLNDPTGDLPWDEEPGSQDVVHVNSEKEFNKLVKKSKLGMLVMFYAPWCGHCKKLKPDYSKAATALKGEGLMVAVNCDLPANMKLKQTYDIKGFPTLNYFKDGKMQFAYGGEHNFQSLVDWMGSPEEPKEKEPEKSWADEEDVHVTFLTGDNFDSFLETHKSVLVKFYAPWCGHCKTMKPIFNSVAKQLKEDKSEGVIAFVDTTVEQELGKRFNIKGFPTIKYFEDGEFAYDYSERDEAKILAFMRNPQKPEAPEKEPEWKDEPNSVIHAEDANFHSTIKTKKHALAFFYAPWCGHCKTAKPHFAKAADHFADDLKRAFVAVDCTKEKAVCEKYEVKGFPTIMYFNFGKEERAYEGGREFKDFKKFMSNPEDPNAGKADPRDDWLELEGNEHVNLLDDKTFDEFADSKAKVLVMFYAPWCGHCTSMKPAYALAAKDMKAFLPGAYLAAVDATKSPALAKRFELKGFPTIKYFEQGKFQFDYAEPRTKDAIVSFMREPKKPAPPAPVEDTWSEHPGHEHVNMLTDQSFDEFINSKPKVMVMFYAPWCGHCKMMKPDYSAAAKDMKAFLPGAYLAAVDATVQQELAKRFELKGFPTLKYFEGGKVKADYNGGRTKDAIVSFMRDGPAKTEL